MLVDMALVGICTVAVRTTAAPLTLPNTTTPPPANTSEIPAEGFDGTLFWLVVGGGGGLLVLVVLVGCGLFWSRRGAVVAHDDREDACSYAHSQADSFHGDVEDSPGKGLVGDGVTQIDVSKEPPRRAVTDGLEGGRRVHLLDTPTIQEEANPKSDGAPCRRSQ
ncbi:hypothetical protein T484DRAFT_1762029 [Baffinella frigidus]|nr:hypothetical protein T484DRAFT_1762029 [Cryptophyta sp. CCMP2293]